MSGWQAEAEAERASGSLKRCGSCNQMSYNIKSAYLNFAGKVVWGWPPGTHPCTTVGCKRGPPAAPEDKAAPKDQKAAPEDEEAADTEAEVEAEVDQFDKEKEALLDIGKNISDAAAAEAAEDAAAEAAAEAPEEDAEGAEAAEDGAEPAPGSDTAGEPASGEVAAGPVKDHFEKIKLAFKGMFNGERPITNLKKEMLYKDDGAGCNLFSTVLICLW